MLTAVRVAGLVCFLTGFEVLSKEGGLYLVLQTWSREVMRPSGEASAVVLLSGHNVPVKLASKYLQIGSYVTVTAGFDQGSLLLQGFVVIEDTHSWPNC